MSAQEEARAQHCELPDPCECHACLTHGEPKDPGRQRSGGPIDDADDELGAAAPSRGLLRIQRATEAQEAADRYLDGRARLKTLITLALAHIPPQLTRELAAAWNEMHPSVAIELPPQPRADGGAA